MSAHILKTNLRIRHQHLRSSHMLRTRYQLSQHHLPRAYPQSGIASFIGKVCRCKKEAPKDKMPEIARFYGIVVKVFFGDHPPPHFHAVYGEHNALISIESLESIEGDLPKRAQKLVIEWASLYQKDLIEIWESQEFRKLPPLK